MLRVKDIGNRPPAEGRSSRTAVDAKRIREIELLLAVNRRMAAYDSLDEVLGALVEMTTSELNTERGSLFLNDPETNELYSRVAQGNIRREIRILNNTGISEFTYKALKATYTAREIDVVVVKGKSQPVAVYEVMDHHTEESYPGLMDALRQFREALAQYRKRRFREAAAAFREVLAINGVDKAAQLYIDRCEYFDRTPPSDDWNGVWVMEGK